VLKLFPQPTWNCQLGTRRRFLLEVGSLAGLGLSLDRVLRSQAAAAAPTRDMNCILIWTQGGTSHIDSIDPKPQASSDIRGEFGVIPTAVPGIPFSDLMQHFAKKLHTFAVLRNLNPQNGSHSVADAIMLSGKPFSPTLTYPCFGSVVAKVWGSRNSLPPFIQVGSHVDRRARGGTAGYLGIEYNPFELPGDPSSDKFSVRDVTPPGGISFSRVQRRKRALELLDNLPRKAEQHATAIEATDKFYQNAFDIIASPQTKKAFDLSAEKANVRDAYGRHYLGQGCLLARRLVESGSRFITVSSGGWDTHKDNFQRLREKLPPLDQAFPALVNDLHERGMLDSTLVVWMTDFGRTPVINANSGRDHSSTASFICMAGAGTPAGVVIGKTDATATRTEGGEYYSRDVAATIYTKLGFPLETAFTAPDGRPIFLCDGEPISELMS
jgi:hypothetical protein